MSNDFVLLSDIINGLDISRAIVNTVVKKGYIELYKVEKEIDLLDELNVKRTYPMSPTHEQKNAIDIIMVNFMMKSMMNVCYLELQEVERQKFIYK